MSVPEAIELFTRLPLPTVIALPLIAVMGALVATTNWYGAFWTGPAVVALAALMLVLVWRAWRLDVALVDRLQDERPIAAWAAPASNDSIYGALVLAGLIIALPFGTIVVAVPLLLGLILLVVAPPSGGRYLGAYEDGIRLARSGNLRGAPWTAVLVHTSSDYPPKPVGLALAGEVGIEPLTPEMAAVIAPPVFAAWSATARERLAAGDTLDFGDVTLTSHELSKGPEVVPVDDITRVGLNPSFLIIEASERKVEIVRSGIGNAAVFHALLSELVTAVAQDLGAQDPGWGTPIEDVPIEEPGPDAPIEDARVRPQGDQDGWPFGSFS